jgi:alcohol dehydrogenase
MRTVECFAFGDLEHLVDGNANIPEIESGDVLVRNHAVGFNPIDFQTRKHGFEELRTPMVLGFDVAGVVERVGPDVSSVHPGDEVMAWLGGPSMAGGYAEYSRAPAALVALKPKNTSFEEAAAVPLAGLTALRCLQRNRCGAQRSLLIAGGAGGVGSWGILIARALGCERIVTTSGTEEGRSYIRNCLGIPERQIIHYLGLDRADLAAAARHANDGALFDATVDCVGGGMTTLCCDVVGFGGTVTVLVSAPLDSSHPPNVASEETLFARAAAVHFELIFSEAEYGGRGRQTRYAGDLQTLGHMIESGRLQLPRITTLGRLSAATVRNAHRILEAGHARGKLVASVD